jgi:hypothetical protein
MHGTTVGDQRPPATLEYEPRFWTDGAPPDGYPLNCPIIDWREGATVALTISLPVGNEAETMRRVSEISALAQHHLAINGGAWMASRVLVFYSDEDGNRLEELALFLWPLG